MTGIGYTLPAALSVIAVCGWELFVLRTGLLRKPAYWIAIAIVLGFQVPVDGWLTKLSAPIVLYAPEHTLGLRFPWDIPVEDFLFGFGFVTAVLLLWEHQRIERTTIMTSVGYHGMHRSAVPVAFDGCAETYDRLVGLNPGYHEHLRVSARRLRIPAGGAGMRLLDVGCGTGASTAALLAEAPRAEIVAIDASEGMLAEARKKTWPSSVRFMHTSVESLSSDALGGVFDGALAAYVIRNLAEPERQVGALATLLRPGAPLAVHEYSVRDSMMARIVWHTVCWSVIIPTALVVTGRTALYRHLWRSVATFDGTAHLRRRLSRAGFIGVHSETMTGWQRGVVHTFLAHTPATTDPT